MWNIVPPGGWAIIENDTRIESETHDSLVEFLAAYRNANNLPAGDPEATVDRYLLSRWPYLAGAGATDPALDDADKPQLCYGQPVRKKLSERLFSWCANRYSRLGSINIVPAEEAERRSGICIDCPANNVRWREQTISACAPCAERVATLDSTLFKVRQGKEVVRCKSIGACEILGQDNRTAIWLDNSVLQHAKHYQDELPAHCWLKR